MVIQGLAFEADFHQDLYATLNDIVVTAIGVRRDQRVSTDLLRIDVFVLKLFKPTHGGSFAQIGWNAGPRHARVFGLAKSFSKKLSSATMIDQDEDCIGALTLFWSLLQVKMPSEIMSAVQSSLEESGLPSLATRNVPEGGYVIYFILSHN